MKKVNEKLIGLEAVTGLPVEESDYGGDLAEHIVYDYADERGELHGDDAAITITHYMQIRARLEKQREYDSIKDGIWDYLEAQGFYDISAESYCERETDGVFRYLVFECSYTGLKGE